jgi:hypothetical protein
MPVKLKFVHIFDFKSKSEFEAYCLKYYIKWEKYNKTSCTICKDQHKHKMFYKLGFCTNTICNQQSLCNIRYKATYCNEAHIKLYRLNEYERGIVFDPPQKSFGISAKAKEIIGNLVYEHQITKPKKLHIRLHKNEFQAQLPIIPRNMERDCSKIKSLKKFHNYFTKQWISMRFNKWQIFLKPFGYAITNCSIEQYNNNIKINFTERLKWHILTVMEKFRTLVQYESKAYKEYETVKIVKKKHRKRGSENSQIDSLR